MSSKPILFNTEMVKAILDGRKMQTRRVFSKTQLKYFDYAQKLGEMSSLDNLHENDFAYILQFSQYKVGDVLWVREPAKVKSPPIATCKKLTFKYLADNKITEIYLDDDFDHSKKWIQRCQGVPNGCIKEMARIFLKVTNVKFERLQDVKYSDIEKELGVNADNYKQYTSWSDLMACDLKDTWNSTAKDGYKWEDNPYVFVYEFERIEKQ